MSKKPIIAVDIDEVLFPMMEAFLAYHNQNFGTVLKLQDMHSYYVEEITGETTEQMLAKLAAYLQSEYYTTAQPLQDSIEAIKKLSHSYNLVLLTARDHFYRGSTEEFIEKHFPSMFRELHYTHTVEDITAYTPKYVICQKLNATALIDDSLHTAELCAEHGLNAVLFGDYPWNQTNKLSSGVTRCKDWSAVLEYFDGLS